ncbi:MAG: hypothetical protein PSW75_02285 [bacterium]|nr:hypothetical protein [bacterium]MDI1336984.1 hypothetical protein [Lacunisphaera sp.]
MKTMNFSTVNARCAAIVLVAAVCGLVGLPARAQSPGPVKLEDARLDEFTLERAGMFDVVRPAKKLTLDAAKADPEAAVRAGLWDVAGKGPARKVTLDDAKNDPLAAERAGLWNVAKARKVCAVTRK